jgi:RNA polymerase sigma factor (sigma-70 family)
MKWTDEKNRTVVFTRFYEKHKLGVYNYALKMLNKSESAADVTQNVFLKFYENIDKIREIDKSHIWIFKTARNEIYGNFRKKVPEKVSINNDPENELEIKSDSKPAEETEIKELKSLLISEINKLPEINRETILMREFGGLSYKEIAEILNIDINVVKSRLFKTRKKLIERISKLI